MKIETAPEIGTPKGLLESVMKEDGISVEISDISLQEVSELPQSFKKQLYDKFTHRKG